MGKVKKRRGTPSARIRVRQPDRAVTTDAQKPIFSLRYVSRKFCITACEKIEKASFADTLYKLSQCTWGELKLTSSRGLGYEKIRRSAIRVEIAPQITDDVNFIAFRFYKNAPMVGYREREIFHIIWFDRRFSLYKHGT